MTTRTFNLLHNCVVHPICGALWWLGFKRLPDALHDWGHKP